MDFSTETGRTETGRTETGGTESGRTEPGTTDVGSTSVGGTDTGSTDTGAASRPGPAPAVEGDFTTRLTVRADRPEPAARLAAWAGAQGLDLTTGVRDRGRTPSRPVLTLRGTGSLDAQRHAAELWSGRLAEAGFPVIRTAIAAAPWNAGVPGTDAEAAVLPAHCHFAHRVTLRLRIPYDTQRLAAVVEGHAARVSRTARRVLSGGVQERYVTQRAFGSGRPSARARLDALLDALAAAGFPAADVEEEFVLLDDNPGA
ncbi:hypothetical protein [Streptomyces sp. NPDC088261]|uniref:hypothetical protein n=1 Tax=Streptomyces sp. NPDC088261 TaxID=3365851 RepID=UPI0037F16490